MLYLHHQPQSYEFGTRRALEAADGYLYLGMPKEALNEIEAIQGDDRNEAAVMLVHARILLHQKKWRDAEKLAASAAVVHPEREEFTVQRAFALHQLQEGEKAMTVLDSAPEWIRKTGILHYNLACYEAQLGDLSTARQCIRVACQMNKAMKKNAAMDPDLRALWN